MTQEITGQDQLNWMMERFNKTSEEAIKIMIEHNQDMSFLEETTPKDKIKMTNRITKKTLGAKLERLNAKLKLHESSHMELDFAECYGGYCLVNYKGSHHATPRMSGKEMDQYLNGALDWIT